MVVDEDEEDDDDELEDDEDEVEVVLEDVVDVLEEELDEEALVDALEEELDEEALVDVLEELGVVVDSVEDGVWLDETVCDWVLVLFDEVELRTRYPPTATTITTITTTPTTAVPKAARLPRANEGKRPETWFLRPISLKTPHDWVLIRFVSAESILGATRKKFDLGTLVSQATGPPATLHGNA